MKFFRWIKRALTRRKQDQAEREAGRAWAEAAMASGLTAEAIERLADEKTHYGRGMLDALPQVFP